MYGEEKEQGLSHNTENGGTENHDIIELGTSQETAVESINTEETSSTDYSYYETGSIVENAQVYGRTEDINGGASEDKEPKKKKRFGKAAGFVAKAALFGIIAGAAFLGVNYGAGILYPGSKSVKETERLPITVTTSTVQNGGNGSNAVDVSDIVAEVMPSVVSVVRRVSSNLTYGPFSLGKQEYDSSGSGIIVGQSDTELLIATNNHVIEEAENIKVTFTDATPDNLADDITVDALVKGTQPDNDLAVIAVPLESIPEEVLSYIKIAALGDSNNLKVGEGTIAIGNALGYGQSVTKGCVSALNREVTIDNRTLKMIQTDAAINSGNSGGALLNMNGEVIGINSAKAIANNVEGMGYAIPISSVVDIINELMNRETRFIVEPSEQGYLGIQGVNITRQYSEAYGAPMGVSVQNVVEGSAAEAAGIKKFDIITKFDGQTITSRENLKDILQYYHAGETVKIVVQYIDNHEYVERELELTLQKADPNQ